MFRARDLRAPLLRRRAPRQKHDAPTPHSDDRVDDFLRELLPAFVAVRVGFVRADRQARVEEQHALLRPRGEEAAVLLGRDERGVVALQGGVHVFQTGWGRRGWADGETQAVGLVVVVVRVLAEDDGADVREGRVPGPGVDFVERWEDFLAGVDFLLEKAFEVEEGGGGDFVAEVRKPGWVEGLDFQLEEVLLFGREG